MKVQEWESDDVITRFEEGNLQRRGAKKLGPTFSSSAQGSSNAGTPAASVRACMIVRGVSLTFKENGGRLVSLRKWECAIGYYYTVIRKTQSLKGGYCRKELSNFLTHHTSKKQFWDILMLLWFFQLPTTKIKIAKSQLNYSIVVRCLEFRCNPIQFQLFTLGVMWGVEILIWHSQEVSNNSRAKKEWLATKWKFGFNSLNIALA